VPKKTSTWINPNRKDEPGERELAMGKMRASGMTLDQIGATYGITRERVRQLLMKYRLDGPIEFKNTYVCITCGDRFPRGAAPEHRKTHRVYFGRGLMTPEMELRNEYIAEAYLRGDRIEDISRAVRTKDGRPTTYTSLYRALQYQGIEPNRGAGRYKRTLEGKERLRMTRRNGTTPYRGWRAPDDE